MDFRDEMDSIAGDFDMAFAHQPPHYEFARKLWNIENDLSLKFQEPKPFDGVHSRLKIVT